MITRRTLMAASGFMLLMAGSVSAQTKPGLAERRAITAYREEKWPAIQKAIQEAAGFEVPVEVDWDRLAIAGDSAHYADDEYFGKTIFQPLTEALRSITRDDMGRQALRQNLQRIQITFNEETAPASNYPNGLTFDNGALTINWRPFSNTADYEPRVEALTQLLESKL